MTIGQAVERANVSEPVDGSPYWADVAVRFANRMAWADFSRGDLANLRRMRPERPGPAVYWRLMGQEDLLGSPALEVKWALILHGIALMTSTVPGDSASRNAHDGIHPWEGRFFWAVTRSGTRASTAMPDSIGSWQREDRLCGASSPGCFVWLLLPG